MEESVNRLLAALLHKPEAIEDANLRFYQKLCLIRALTPLGSDSMLDAAEKLNTIRNRLAHHLDYPQMEAQVREFLSLCEEPEDPEEELELEGELELEEEPELGSTGALVKRPIQILGCPELWFWLQLRIRLLAAS